MNPKILVCLVSALAFILVLLLSSASRERVNPHEKELLSDSGGFPNADEVTQRRASWGGLDLAGTEHYYDPETTMHFQHRLAWVLEPFDPAPEEFQFIAQHLAAVRGLTEVVSEDEFFTVAGRARYGEEVEKLDAILREQLGEERFARYQYTTNVSEGYSKCWRLAMANGLSEEQADELRALASDYSREVHGVEIDGMTPVDDWETWDADFFEQDQGAIRSAYIERIRSQFGEPVLSDILAHGIATQLFVDLGIDLPEGTFKTAWNDAATRQRLSDVYGITTGYTGPDGTSSTVGPTTEIDREREASLAAREQAFQQELMGIGVDN